MSDVNIDDAILSFFSSVEGRWRKVAMVISKVSDAIKNDLLNEEEGYRLIAARIEALVSAGLLEAQGNVKRWRHSEVRRPKLETSNA